MEIRRATVEDCKKLAVLKRKIWETTYRGIYPDEKLDNYSINLNEQKFKEMIQRQSQTLFVALKESEMIGYMSCGEILRAFNHYTHDIGLLYVAKEYQGKGIGGVLFRLAKKELSHQGVTTFIVSCNKYNLPAQHFYKKIGGKIEEDQKDRSLPQVKFQFTA